MSKVCPDCGESVPNNAHFCPNCGHDFFNKDKTDKSNDSAGFFSDGKIFLVLIAVVVIVGAFVLFSTFGGNDSAPQVAEDNVEHVGLTISDINGYSGSNSGRTYYSLSTSVFFTHVPSDKTGYLLKTIYYDKNNTELGQETETLSNAYYDTDYSITIGYCTMYKKPNIDHANVEVIKDGKTIDNFTCKANPSKISFLN